MYAFLTRGFYNPSPGGGITRDGRAPDVSAPSARYPFEITLHQGAIEAIFLDSMRQYGLQIDRPIIPTAIRLDDRPEVFESLDSNPVEVIQHETEIVHAKYVLGADGAHSWVRGQLNFTMDGEQTDYVWGVVDMIPKTTDFPDIRNRVAIHGTTGSCMVIPREGDVERLYIQLSDDDAREVLNAKGRIDKTRWTPQRLMAIAKRSLQPYTIEFPEEVNWWTLYIIGQRFASSFSLKERIFIAADACHTHSPKAGQGMNTSITSRGRSRTSCAGGPILLFSRPMNSNDASTRRTLSTLTGSLQSCSPANRLTHPANQPLASQIEIGKRMPPQVVLSGIETYFASFMKQPFTLP
ncbi:hypothetical protein ACEPAI_3275 [Sanghuangporus weigelae]